MAHTYQPAKLFTPDEANAMLPLIRAIVGDIVGLSGEANERRERLQRLLQGRERSSDDPYTEELAQMEQAVADDLRKIQGYVKELDELGVELKDPVSGLVDFPCELEGRTVYLCWMYDEPAVQHWHDLDAGFEGRQKLA